MNLNKWVAGFLLALLLVSCHQQHEKTEAEDSPYERLEAYLSHYDKKIQSYKYVLTLSGQGCLTCNRSFAEFADPFSERDSVLVVLLDKGLRIDVSPFEGKENTIDDYLVKIRDYKFEVNSSIYILSENSIDTIINISANNIEDIVNNFPGF